MDFIDAFLKKGGNVALFGPNIGREELKDLKEDLVRLCTAFAADGAEEVQDENDDDMSYEYDD